MTRLSANTGIDIGELFLLRQREIIERFASFY